MAVKIRLRRVGKKKVPHYRIVVADSRAARDGRFIEQIGTYDPKKEPTEAKIDKERAMEWIKDGAQISETVKSLMKKNGIDPDEFKKAIKKKK
jgi:small subunit ribosomal protein S16